MTPPHFYLKLDFREGDRPDEEAIDKLVDAIAQELTWHKPEPGDGLFDRNGWGMSNRDGSSHNFIAKVSRYKPTKPTSRSRDIVVQLGGIDAVSYPEHKVKGRFVMRGRIVSGVKGVVGRRALAMLTHAQLQRLVNEGTEMLLKYPTTGTMPDYQQGA